jgi:hypothetical protein
MKFWKGNRIDGEFDMPVADVAAQFAAQYDADTAGWPLERELRGWLTGKDGLDSVWVDEDNGGVCTEHKSRGPEHDACTRTETFAELYGAVLDLIYPDV